MEGIKNGRHKFYLGYCLYKDGVLHREDGPAVEYSNGDKQWYLFGSRHRIDGPAVEYSDGSKEWWVDGLRHREDGPAIMHTVVNFRTNNFSRHEWWISGLNVTEEEFNAWNEKKGLNEKPTSTLEQKVAAKKIKK